VGWESEAFSEAASIQLKALSTLLAENAGPTAQDLQPLLADDFVCGTLRPRELQQVFRDAAEQIVVSRSERSPSSAQFSGAQGFIAAAGELLQALGNAQRRMELKLVRVSLAMDRVESTVYFHAGSHGTNPRQQNAVWQVTWNWTGGNDPPVIRRIECDPDSYEEIVTSGRSGQLFSDCTNDVLNRNGSFPQELLHSQAYWTARLEADYGVEIGAFHGLALGDVNGDGLEDLYLCLPGGLPNRLFVQNADGTATERAREAGLDFCDFTRHALFVDLDNDGDQDLALLINASLMFLENDGTPRFAVRGSQPLPSAAYSISAVDFDLDRLLDLHVTGRDALSGENRPKSILGNPVPYHDATNGGTDFLWRNLGNFQFEDVADQVGLSDFRFSQAASWEDYDNDGDLDLCVANDFGRKSLYRHDGGKFTEVAEQAGVLDIGAGMSVSWGDANNDGLMDLYLGNMFSSAGNRVAHQARFHADADEITKAMFQRHARGNSLFLNRGDGTFRDASLEAGVTMGRWAWSSNFFDLNNDGWLDIVVANGFVTNEQPDDL
jgi:hypothetical protein